MIMHGVAWLLNDLFFENSVWAGFLVEAGSSWSSPRSRGLFAYRSFKKGAPPTPDMAMRRRRRSAPHSKPKEAS